jgi:phosphatidylserine/phosphatidylglycerophosphate/cardiolipin synthase-like enzyme
MRADLSTVATSTLERLRDAIASKRIESPLTREGLLALGIQRQLDALDGALGGHSTLACLSVLDATLSERRARQRPAPELVWSGPERAHATARDTAVVLRDLFDGAKQQVILAGYAFQGGGALMAPLWRAMRERAVEVKLFIHLKDVEKLSGSASKRAERAIRNALDEAWPPSDVTPQIFYDPRALDPRAGFSSLHAKCVVVDNQRAFVSSANFTDRAQTRNIECGVLLDDPIFASHLARQWLGLVSSGLVTRLSNVSE